MKMVHRYLVVCSFILTVLTIVSCEQTSEPNLPGKLNPKNYGSLTTDTTPVVGYLMFVCSALHNPNTYTPTTTATANAYFGDGSDLVDPTSVTVNSQTLTKLSTGNYSHGHPTIPTSPYTVSWSATGYLGSTLSKSLTMPTPLAFTNFTSGDTISKATGRTISYNGSGSNTMFVDIIPHGSLNAYLISPDSVPTNVYSSFSQSNNGSLVVTAGSLASLPANRWYWITATVFAYSRETYQGEQIGFDLSYDISAFFYLKP